MNGMPLNVSSYSDGNGGRRGLIYSSGGLFRFDCDPDHDRVVLDPLDRDRIDVGHAVHLRGAALHSSGIDKVSGASPGFHDYVTMGQMILLSQFSLFIIWGDGQRDYKHQNQLKLLHH